MSKMPYMRLYAGDALSDAGIVGLSMTAFGCWMKTIMLMWTQQQAELSRPVAYWKRAFHVDDEQLEMVLRELEDNEVGKVRWNDKSVTFYSSRVQSELDKLDADRERKRASRSSKRGNEYVSDSSPNRVRVESDSTPDNDNDSSTEVKEKKKKEKVSFSENEIEAVYQLYPRKTGKRAAKTAIRKALERIAARGQPEPVDWLAEKVEVFARSPKGRAGDFCPYPATWFNEDRFDDDENEWNRDNATDQRKHTRSYRELPFREKLRLAGTDPDGLGNHGRDSGNGPPSDRLIPTSSGR